MSQPRGGHQLNPVGLAIVIIQVPVSCRAVVGSYSQFAQLQPLRHPFLCLYCINKDVLKAPVGRRTFSMLNSLPQLTAAAGNYIYAYLQIWARESSPWCPANVFIINVDLLLQFFMLTLTLCLCHCPSPVPAELLYFSIYVIGFLHSNIIFLFPLPGVQLKHVIFTVCDLKHDPL
jgi:hypothetical protein